MDLLQRKLVGKLERNLQGILNAKETPQRFLTDRLSPPLRAAWHLLRTDFLLRLVAQGWPSRELAAATSALELPAHVPAWLRPLPSLVAPDSSGAVQASCLPGRGRRCQPQR